MVPGVRGDVLGIPTSSSWPDAARLREHHLPGERVRARARIRGGGARGIRAVHPDVTFPPVQPGDSVAAFLQLEISIGAHGAHPF